MRQKTSDLRQLLASTILHVRSGRATSRTGLARSLEISASTVGIYVDQLIATGHLDESGLEHGSMGRPKRRIQVSGSLGWFAGVEFTASRVQLIGLDFSGKMIEMEEIRLPEDPSIAEVKEIICAGLTRWQSKQALPLLGIGVGAPGLVNSQEGISLRYAFVRGWENVPVRDLLVQKFGVPVMVENNLRAIALAERWFGSHREESNYVVVGARSGFGIACVQGGVLIHGANHAAGEVGLWPWPLAGECTRGELHHWLNAPMAYRRLAGISETAPVPEDLYTAMSSLVNDRGTLWDEVVMDYARVLGCVQLLMDPSVCLLHGPLTALGDRFCQAIMDASLKIAPALGDLRLQLVRSQLGDNAGALGAASLAMETWMPTFI
ncbi:putative NBD/HSP70 family sugar kinase [Prosthecobacter fusiformis]|uniref:Putative NBD/HSP70 family sugar kinase n=1 Tax=Prosthecobacter fusiformis TaxID=48464 RepID=A0A4R7RYG0_9BACT|nr:ROK family protein [Prosthecobacter fusiformis]TDU70984.1 putative NBD/HSP70 family sugar kinase [Prosthecobacter fusiformis]